MVAKPFEQVTCPVCGSRSTGRIGARHYYCWDCCIEFSTQRDGTIELFSVQLDGTLEALDDGKEELLSE